MSDPTRYLSPAPPLVADLLSRPVDDNEPLDEMLLSGLCDRLKAAGGVRRRERIQLDAFVVEHGRTLRTTPFAWTARAARRSLGRRAARLVSSGEEPDLLSAVNGEIDRQCDRALRGLARPGALGTWLAGASDALRATCAVEAASWASGLLTLLSPEYTGIRVGIADAWFDVPGAPITLHGRRDGVLSAPPALRVGILRVSDGLPGPHAGAGLAVDGLVSAFAAADRRAPSRVLGAWPDAGIVLCVELDASRVAATTALLAATAAAPAAAPIQLVAA